MAISQSDLKLLFQKSGNRCAFPNCGKQLFIQEDNQEKPTLISNIAHIVAQSNDGPRGNFALDLEKRDQENNLLLLCPEHHKLIDDQPERYSVERLRGIKTDHELFIEKSTGNYSRNQNYAKSQKEETVFSNIFEVLRLPIFIYETKSIPRADIELASDNRTVNSEVIYSYIEKKGFVYSFFNPADENSPIKDFIDKSQIKQIKSRIWWENPSTEKWFVELLNKSIDTFMYQKGLEKDIVHSRYFFKPDTIGESKSINYRPLNQNIAQKQVVWSPITKKTGVNKSYWLHRAISIKFIRITSISWCLSLRPEFRVTKDGITLLNSERIGSKITKKKSRMFNFDLFGEVNFWRSYLSNNEPRIIINFGQTNMIISSNLLSCTVNWPGIPERFAKSFSNIEYAEDLFTWQKLQDLPDEVIFETDDNEEDY
jgi:hypothetical protein